MEGKHFTCCTDTAPNLIFFYSKMKVGLSANYTVFWRSFSFFRLSCLLLKSLCTQKEGELGQRRKEKGSFEKITLLDYKSWKLVCNFAPGDQTANQECCREQNGIPNKLAISKKPIKHGIKAHKENKFIQPTLSEFLIMCTTFSHHSLSSSTGTVWKKGKWVTLHKSSTCTDT